MSLPAIASLRSDEAALPRVEVVVREHMTMMVEETVYPYKDDPERPHFYRVLFGESDDEICDQFCRALKKFLNGAPPGVRHRVTGTPGRITDPLSLRVHVRRNVICVGPPFRGSPVHAYYFPYGTAFPYASHRYSLGLMDEWLGHVVRGLSGSSRS